MRSLFVIALVLVLFSGCDWKPTQPDDAVVVARVGESVLTLDELVQKDVYRSDMSVEDSTRAVRSYIQRWAKDQILVERARFNLSDQQQDFDKKVEDYRRDLLIFAYQQAYLKQNLDTVFSKEEIQAFYNDNKDMFTLRENIYRFDYVALPTNSPGLDDLKKRFFKADDPDDFTERVFAFAKLLSIGDTSWYSFSDVMRLIPALSEYESDFISRKKRIIHQDDETVYLVALNDVKLKETEAPVEYVESSIVTILLNQRKREVLRALEEKLLKDGIKKNQVEFY